METKFTPGPWDNNKWNSHEHQISALGGTVALVSHSHSLISEDSADANAHLIAAAPEMYAALSKAKVYIGDCGLPDLIEEVAAALKKARGE